MVKQTQYPKLERRATYAIRLRTAERRLIEAAAAAHGERFSEYVRRAAVTLARNDVVRHAAGGTT